MTAFALEQFIDAAEAAAGISPEPADCVQAVAPLMLRLLGSAKSFLEPRHFRDDPRHYARNAVHIAESDGLSLYTLVWNPGQWTPVHDYGTWGVVGIVSGVLEERNFIRLDHQSQSDSGIKLARGGPILLGEGTVTTFVPNPDHIHKTGVPEDREQTVSRR
jgi:predicted metal-dependent enzyme (double-stranded beta helix superfamily)